MVLQHSQEDQLIVDAQLGRPARGSWAVACRCHLDVPMVIENHPRTDEGRPFPTLFWLTCPILVKRASRFESQGWMSELTHRLGSDEALKARFSGALDRYVARRDQHAELSGQSSPPGGGPERVKCLHAHVAHELADGPNAVGALTLAATGWPDCAAPCFRVVSE